MRKISKNFLVSGLMLLTSNAFASTVIYSSGDAKYCTDVFTSNSYSLISSSKSSRVFYNIYENATGSMFKGTTDRVSNDPNMLFLFLEDGPQTDMMIAGSTPAKEIVESSCGKSIDPNLFTMALAYNQQSPDKSLCLQCEKLPYPAQQGTNPIQPGNATKGSCSLDYIQKIALHVGSEWIKLPAPEIMSVENSEFWSLPNNEAGALGTDRQYEHYKVAIKASSGDITNLNLVFRTNEPHDESSCTFVY